MQNLEVVSSGEREVMGRRGMVWFVGHESDLRGEQEVRGHRAAHPGLSKGCGNTHDAGGDLGEAEASTKTRT